MKKLALTPFIFAIFVCSLSDRVGAAAVLPPTTIVELPANEFLAIKLNAMMRVNHKLGHPDGLAFMLSESEPDAVLAVGFVRTKAGRKLLEEDITTARAFVEDFNKRRNKKLKVIEKIQDLNAPKKKQAVSHGHHHEHDHKH